MASGKRILRRTFLKHGAAVAAGAAGVPYFVPTSALGQAGATAPSERIVVGGIGIGNQGEGDLRNFLAQSDVRVVAVCDVNQQNLQKAIGQVNGRYGNEDCKGYTDYRELLARDDINAVLIATPHHWHVTMGIAAAKAGKDMYCEKPMGMAISWDLELREAVKRYGILFQFGTQQRSDARFYRACELVRQDHVGQVKQIRVVGPSGGRESLPAQPEPTPEWLDHDQWVGPALDCPYMGRPNTGVRSDRSLGSISEWGVHMLDIIDMAGQHKPETGLTIEGIGEYARGGGPEDCPVEYDVTMRYGNGIEVEYKSGNWMPLHWRTKYLLDPVPDRRWEHGIAFEGTEGWVYVDREMITASSQSMLDASLRLGGIPRGNHVRNFLDCVKTRQPPSAAIEQATQADILSHLAYLAIHIGQRLEWDAAKNMFVNNDCANRMLTRAMRSPCHT